MIVTNHGSIVLFTPETATEREWIDEHVQSEGWQWMGQSLTVDTRFAGDLAEGMAADGITVGDPLTAHQAAAVKNVTKAERRALRALRDAEIASFGQWRKMARGDVRARMSLNGLVENIPFGQGSVSVRITRVGLLALGES